MQEVRGSNPLSSTPGTLSLVGQPIAVTEKPANRPGIVRFETNRSFTGMGHEHYHSLADATGPRPPDEIARRLLATGKVDGVHVYMNMITVDVKKGHDTSGLERRDRRALHLLAARDGAAGLRGRRGRRTRGWGTGRVRRRARGRRDVGSREDAFPPRCSNAAASRVRRPKRRPRPASRPRCGRPVTRRPVRRS